ncbi:protein phosphatase methylesterase 1 [Anoplophora glabripennis]|uniref:protein phosphatase methylesterase 1 n=1 Tax=Anoplophora glabripennis TaxID=217634 RepID=UPI0008742FBA|nr:protein phosphatase methylesterase 1 [Anoplophora glabripennis]
MSDLRKSVLGMHAKRSGLAAASKQDFTPVKWTEYFDSEEKIQTEHGNFHLFSKGNEGPILLCLHGGGYSGLTWSLFAAEILKVIHCQVKAVDLRGHGNTTTNNDYDLSLETLASDVVEVANYLIEKVGTPIILMGHSMGGAVAVEAAYHIKSVVGLCVIDVVEGTALDALSSMQSILRGRPSHFKSLPHAIQWCYKGGQTHNLEAARVSMPGQIVNMKTNKLAADECDDIDMNNIELTSSSHRELVASSYTLTEVAEESDESDEAKCSDCGKPPLPKSQKTDVFKCPNNFKVKDDGPQYTWRIDLSKTEQFWTGWFKGLSQKFLDIRIPKILLLANIHGLDTTLTVGQMQGKFQMQVLARSGHAIHEDQPHNVAEIVSGYLVKQKLAEPKSDFIQPPLPSC